MKRIVAPLLLVALLLTSCATQPRTSVSALPRFSEAEQADVIIRYYSDETSYVLKPAAKEGEFLTIFKKEAVLALAKQQLGRQLVVVLLIHYTDEGKAEAVKKDWTNLLTQTGYRRVVFLRALNSMQVNGLPVLAGGG
jgi:type IV pilus biogenesis protein CpaD/CtpE